MRSVSSLLIVALCAREVAADAKTAEAAFEKGLELMKKGKYTAACAQFRASLEEDFQYGALYVLAGCEEKRGHLATSWNAYKRVAGEDINMERRKRAQKLADEIEERLPKLQFVIEPRPDGMVVTIDDDDVTAQIESDIPVDLGERVIAVSAPGYVEYKKTIDVTEEGKIVRVEVKPKRKKEPKNEEQGGSLKETKTVRNWRYGTGQVTMVVGGGLVLTGLVFGTVAKFKYDGAKSDGLEGDRGAIQDARGARTWADRSTILTAVGVGAAGLGLVLWLTGHSTVTVDMREDSTTAVLTGRF